MFGNSQPPSCDIRRKAAQASCALSEASFAEDLSANTEAEQLNNKKNKADGFPLVLTQSFNLCTRS